MTFEGEEYPIHPTLDELIQGYKAFSQEGFPRGIPQPIEPWTPLLRALTRFEAAIVPVVHAYLCGQAVEIDKLATAENIKLAVADFKTRSTDDREYFVKYKAYWQAIENLISKLQQCCEELGNPVKTIKISKDEK